MPVDQRVVAMLFYLFLALPYTGFSHTSFYQELAEPAPLEIRQPPPTTFRGTGSNIEWTLQCDVKACPKVEEALVARFLENVLLLSRSASTCCTDPHARPGRGDFATTCQAPQHLVRQDAANSLYPQALFRQLENVAEEHLEAYDMKISINAAMSFYFPADFHGERKHYQLPFVEALLQQISHGLGMFSFMRMYLPALLTPYMFTSPNASRGQEVRFFFGAFDRRLVFDSPRTPLIAQHLDLLGPIRDVQSVATDLLLRMFLRSRQHYDIFLNMNSGLPTTSSSARKKEESPSSPSVTSRSLTTMPWASPRGRVRSTCGW